MVKTLASYGPLMDDFRYAKIHRFPSPKTIAAIPVAELRELKFGYRADTIVSAARFLCEKGDYWLDSLKKKPYEEAREELLAVKGIGPKLADCIALFALHKTEAVPIDTHVWQAITRVFTPELRGKPLTDARYREASRAFRDRFGELSGWAQQFLFYENMVNWRSRR